MILRPALAASLVAGTLLAALPVLAQKARTSTSTSTVIRHAHTPPGSILQGVTVKPGATLLYLSGQVASLIDPNSKTPPEQETIADYGDTKTQTISVLNKIKAALAERGFAMSDVIKLTVFVVGDPKLGGKMDFDGMNEGFSQFFGTAANPNTVARSTVQVAALADPVYLVEIEATAAK